MIAAVMLVSANTFDADFAIIKQMKILFIYNPYSGKGLMPRQIDYVKCELSKMSSSLDYRFCGNLQELYQIISQPLYSYDVLIFAGGDGTFHHVVNAISAHEYRPILGIIPCGTLNDAAKNFGYNRQLSRSMKIIRQQAIQSVDVFKVNQQYGIFSISAGTFSDIPYAVKSYKKKRFLALSYYAAAFKRLLKKEAISGVISVDKQNEFSFFAPFLLVLNSQYMGGFKINSTAKLDDGIADLLYTEKGWFNGLFRFFFRRHKVHRYSFQEATIRLPHTYSWDVDGEEVKTDVADIKVLSNHLRIIAKK